jgi:dienelactone hydrolase
MREEIGGRVFDVYGALEYLVTIASVDVDRMGLIGWDRGNLSAVAKEGAQKHFETKIPAAVGMSQDCRSTVSGELVAPVLILTGELNDWWPPFSCKRMRENAVISGSSVEVVIYDDVMHSFDDPEVGEVTYLEDAFNHNKSPAIGATLGYNENAHEDATNRVRNFFAKHFQ